MSDCGFGLRVRAVQTGVDLIGGEQPPELLDGGLRLTGRIEERELTQEMRSSYLDYAMSVIVGRALPDVRDGLNRSTAACSTRCTTWRCSPTGPTAKSAFIVGEVMGKYHPHGDSASTTRSPAWRRTSRCATRSSTGRGTSARSTTTRRPP